MLWRLTRTFVYLASGGTSSFTRRTVAMSSSSLIVDTDVGFDDWVALQCLLNTRTVKNTLITTVGGVIDAGPAAKAVKHLFPQAQIGEGLNSPVMPYDPIPAWLESYRSHSFGAFVKKLASTKENDEPKKALPQVVDIISSCPENSLDILCIGPLTNLAHWLEHCTKTDQLHFMSSKIRRIYILGGNHPKLSDSQKDPEFNFGLDPEAARTVLLSDALHDKLFLITSSVCNMHQLESALGKQRLLEFAKAQNSKQFFSTLLEFDTRAYCLSCDPVCAYAMENCSTEWEQVTVDVRLPTGMLVPADKGTGQTIRIASKIDLSAYLEWIESSV